MERIENQTFVTRRPLALRDRENARAEAVVVQEAPKDDRVRTIPHRKLDANEIERLRALPGVRAAATGTQFPPTTFGRIRVAVEGERARDEGALPTPFVTLASDGYFAALGLPVLRGRVPDARDTEATPRVVAMARPNAVQMRPSQMPSESWPTWASRAARTIGSP